MSWTIGQYATTLVGSSCMGLLCAYYIQHSSQWERAQRQFLHSQKMVEATKVDEPRIDMVITRDHGGEIVGTTSSPPPPTSPNMATSASALTGNVVNAVLRDDNTTQNVVVLLKGVFTHHDFLFHLKTHFKEQFTTNDETVSSLKHFVVDGILKDPFVSDQLIGVGKDLGTHLREHPRVHPEPVLELLKNASLDALRSDRFQRELLDSLKEGGKHAVFFGSSPPAESPKK
uniref:Uncharacterized protein n=1 Tax=Bodo saltans TaxID=75058 RepID=B6DTB7_BODSA|nr:hypothetical protein [Bodo saltans]